jgi:hypothetical protein
MAKDRLIIFDTTLRDGEQSPGAAMTQADKLRIAKALERLKVDVIEAGFPIASPGDFEAVRAVARAIKDCTVCGLARTAHEDIDRAAEALKDARSMRIHTFIATSPIHMKNKLRMEPEAVIEAAVSAVKRARQHTDNVEFSAEDASRSEMDFLCRVVEAVIAAGATTINLPDTVGYGLPESIRPVLPRTVIERVPNCRQGGVVGALPQRPRAGRGQLARRHAPARARSSAPSTASASAPATHRSKRSSWRCAPAPTSSGRDRHRDHADRAGLEAGVANHRLSGAAQQGHRRRQCLRPRVGHPPGRRAQAPRDLRDHARRGRGLERQQASCSASSRGATPSAPACRSSASRSRARRT